jgi:DNA-binding MarR family transcriptional regulator
VTTDNTQVRPGPPGPVDQQARDSSLRDGEDLNARLAGTLGWLGPAFARWTASLLPHEETTYTRARVLAVLQRSGPQIMSSVKNDLGLSAATMTALVDALEQGGMLRRTAHPTDRRATVLELTAAGVDCDLADRYNRAAGELFDVLSSDERRTLSAALDTVANRLRERLRDP